MMEGNCCLTTSSAKSLNSEIENCSHRFQITLNYFKILFFSINKMHRNIINDVNIFKWMPKSGNVGNYEHSI